ncbi:MAG: subclass B3 metallo-beta-lactamase [Sphingomonadaceae bacterium]
MFGKTLIALASLALLGVVPPSTTSQRSASASKDIAGACGDRDGWSDPAPPAHIHGHTWYVGTCGITVLLIETTGGLVLIDTGPADAAPHVLANVRALGFDPRQIKWVLMTHEHFDHVGGMDKLLKETGAHLVTGTGAVEVMRTGQPASDDPQVSWLAKEPMKPVKVNRVLGHRQALQVGNTVFTIHANPVHSPGSTSWTWRSCESGACLTIAYADSNSTISTDEYHFSDHPARVEAAREGLRVIEALPCDLLLTPHPGQSALLERLSGAQPMIQPRACMAYSAKGSMRLADRLAREAETK